MMDFSNRDDSLYWDVLTCLVMTLNMRLRWREIRDVLHKKYEKIYDKETLEVMLSRVLKSLVQSGNLKRESKGHQQVYYSIPKRRRKEISEEIDKRLAHKKLDEIWDKLTSEQRKKAVETLVYQSKLIIQSEKTIVKNLSSVFKDWIPELISNVNKPSETVRKEYSPEDKQELLRELGDLQEQFARIETNMAEENKFWKKKWEEMLRLGLEFTNKVVDPLYNGRFNEAIEDLMRKAIEKQDKSEARA